MAPILQAREKLIKGVNAIEGLLVRGDPDAYLVTVGATQFDIFALGDEMQTRGWHSNRLVDPASLHLFLDADNARSVEDYLTDLAAVAQDGRSGHLKTSTSQVVYST